MPAKNETKPSERVVVIYVPMGDWPLCNIGIQMPGCLTDGPTPEVWVQMVVIENATGQIVEVLSQTMVTSK